MLYFAISPIPHTGGTQTGVGALEIYLQQPGHADDLKSHAKLSPLEFDFRVAGWETVYLPSTQAQQGEVRNGGQVAQKIGLCTWSMCEVGVDIRPVRPSKNPERGGILGDLGISLHQNAIYKWASGTIFMHDTHVLYWFEKLRLLGIVTLM